MTGNNRGRAACDRSVTRATKRVASTGHLSHTMRVLVRPSPSGADTEDCRRFRSTSFVTDHDVPPNAESPEPESLEEDQRTLEPVRQALREAGFWAYGTIDETNTWSIAVDDELGRADIRIGQDGFEIQLRSESPGLYAEEDSPWRRQSRSRLARLQIPRIARGFLEPHQSAMWDETVEGVAVVETVEMPFHRAADIPGYIQQRLPAIEDLVTMIERQLG